MVTLNIQLQIDEQFEYAVSDAGRLLSLPSCLEDTILSVCDEETRREGEGSARDYCATQNNYRHASSVSGIN